MKSTRILFASLALLLAVGGRAEATHKAWLQKHSGGQCVYQVTAYDDAYPGVIKNPNPFGQYVTCPFNLAGRSGSEAGPVFTLDHWINAKQAKVHFKRTNSYFWCQARAEDIPGNVYYGRGDGYGPTTNGFHVLDLVTFEADGNGTWGGELETHEEEYIEQLDFECRVGSGASASDPALLIGYEVATCQDWANCNVPRGDAQGSHAYFQGSGIECNPSTAAAAAPLKRSEHGMRNTGTSTHTTHCPLTQVTDDSRHHDRTIISLKVHFTGPTPTCRIESMTLDGTARNSGNLNAVTDLGVTTLQLASQLATANEKNLNLKCDLPANSTIEGWIGRMTNSLKSGGI